eukprot:1089492_1
MDYCWLLSLYYELIIRTEFIKWKDQISSHKTETIIKFATDDPSIHHHSLHPPFHSIFHTFQSQNASSILIITKRRKTAIVKLEYSHEFEYILSSCNGSCGSALGEWIAHLIAQTINTIYHKRQKTRV